MQAMRDHLEGRAELYETTYRIKDKDGNYIEFYDCGQITNKEGAEVTVTGFVLKIVDGVHILTQMKDFKDLILEGHPSIMKLVSDIKRKD